jgi:hypothetical protein
MTDFFASTFVIVANGATLLFCKTNVLMATLPVRSPPMTIAAGSHYLDWTLDIRVVLTVPALAQLVLL